MRYHTPESIAAELHLTPRSVQIVCRALLGKPTERPRRLNEQQYERVLKAFQKQGRHAKTKTFSLDVTNAHNISQNKK